MKELTVSIILAHYLFQLREYGYLCMKHNDLPFRILLIFTG
jgi:hypothetical protein